VMFALNLAKAASEGARKVRWPEVGSSSSWVSAGLPASIERSMDRFPSVAKTSAMPCAWMPTAEARRKRKKGGK